VTKVITEHESEWAKAVHGLQIGREQLVVAQPASEVVTSRAGQRTGSPTPASQVSPLARTGPAMASADS
jgi:hypothetical protein